MSPVPAYASNAASTNLMACGPAESTASCMTSAASRAPTTSGLGSPVAGAYTAVMAAVAAQPAVPGRTAVSVDRPRRVHPCGDGRSSGEVDVNCPRDLSSLVCPHSTRFDWTGPRGRRGGSQSSRATSSMRQSAALTANPPRYGGRIPAATAVKSATGTSPFPPTLITTPPGAVITTWWAVPSEPTNLASWARPTGTEKMSITSAPLMDHPVSHSVTCARSTSTVVRSGRSTEIQSQFPPSGRTYVRSVVAAVG